MIKNLRYIRLDAPTYLPSPGTQSLVIGMPNLQEFSGHFTNEVFSGIPNIKKLISHLTYFQNRIPDWQLDMSRLTKLKAFKFYGSYLSSTVMMLPNLEELKLKNCQTLIDEWILSDEDKFKSLKLLLLSNTNLKCWEASSDNFPNLKRLVLKECHDLQETPAEFGEICTLESIELHDCSTTAENSATNIVQEQEDMENYFLNIYIHNIRRK
ncbi:hypothetical protein RDI58_010130 [Solanum bulbocastanum]|uniref:Uncharacterized protein n=1 Tax=Solanum bulbocastanum TaxID=147425 RepID=A0AAN8YF53_SOLBU